MVRFLSYHDLHQLHAVSLINKINAKKQSGNVNTNAYLRILTIHVISSSSSSLSSQMNFIEVKRKFSF